MPLSDNKPALVVSVLSFLVASASLGISIRSCSTSERLAHLSVEPEVRLYVEGKPRMGTIHVYNPGPITVSSLSVSRFIVLVPYAGSPYSGVLFDGKSINADPLGELWKFSTTLEPRQSTSGEFTYQGDTNKGAERIAVHIYDVAYHRPSDMKEYTKRILFFDDGLKVYNHSEFRSNALYAQVMDNFNRRNADARIRTFRERVRNMTSPVTEGK